MGRMVFLKVSEGFLLWSRLFICECTPPAGQKAIVYVHSQVVCSCVSCDEVDGDDDSEEGVVE